MALPFGQSLAVPKYLVKKKLQREKRFPLVLMLEILHDCNLTCTGCGRIREYAATIKDLMPYETAMDAVDQAGTPVVTITGGEPMMHPQIGEITAGVLAKNRYIYLCTNGLLLERRLNKFTPDRRLHFNVHIDGLEETHDRAVERKGGFRKAIKAIKVAKEAGFQVATNTTIFEGTDLGELEELFAMLKEIGVDGFLVAPGFAYEAVSQKELFLKRAEVRQTWKRVIDLSKKYRFYSTPLYLQFLAGEREYDCTAWGNPTINPQGWRMPCYLISDGHVQTLRQLLDETPWEKYGVGRDPRCENCMMHCGFEPTAALDAVSNPFAAWEMTKWALFSRAS